jgi:hypothetical protein
VQAFLERMRPDQGLELADHLSMPTCRQICLDTILKRSKAHPFQARNLLLHAAKLGHLLQQRPPPQVKSLPKQRRRNRRVSVLKLPGLGDQIFKPQSVDLLRGNSE